MYIFFTSQKKLAGLGTFIIRMGSHQLIFLISFIHYFFQHVCSMNSSFIMFHTLKSSVRIVDKAPILIITNVQKIEVKTILVRNVAKFLRRKIVWEFISKGIIQLPKKHIYARHVKNVLEITNFWKTIFSNHITSRIAHSAKRLCLTKWN